ncbi:hypothetical protein ALC56_06282, partial [Trachymyrmex septentrionalis]
RHDRVTKQRAKNEGGRAKPKRYAAANGARSCALEDHGSQIEGVAKWKLRRRYCLLSHREDPVGPLEHTFAYTVGPWLHSLVASSCPLNNEFHIPSSLGKLTTACLV